MIPRRMLGFGFALFLILFILAVIYSQYAMRNGAGSVETLPVPTGDQPWKQSEAAPAVPSASPAPTSTIVTPETAADDLIDEALTDRDDLSAFTEDELADIEEGN